MKPNQFNENVLVHWLSTLDGTIYEEIIKWHDTHVTKPEPYDLEVDWDKDLLAPDPYSVLYIYYLAAQIDYWNNDMRRYANSMAMFNTAYMDFSSWYNRNYMPKQNNSIIV